MSSSRKRLAIALTVCALSGRCSLAFAQQAPPPSATTDSPERRAILTSDRWRRAEADFEKWLGIQQVYSPAEVAALKADMADRASRLSPAELQKMLTDVEGRLKVLLSPEADEARQWLGDIRRVARNPEAHLGGPLPDVAHMSADEIRAELDRFQQRRAAQRQSQAAFDRTRERQVQDAQNRQAARRGAQGRVQNRPAPTIANAEPGAPISVYSPRQPERVRRRAVYRVGPWGEPIYWDPLDYWRRPREPW